MAGNIELEDIAFKAMPVVYYLFLRVIDNLLIIPIIWLLSLDLPRLCMYLHFLLFVVRDESNTYLEVHVIYLEKVM